MLTLRDSLGLTLSERAAAVALPFSNHATLSNNLVSYWKLDETSGDRADSVGSNTLTDNNTVGYAAGMSGNAASFVAANSESLSNGPGTTFLLNGTTGTTIAGWFYHDGQTNEVIASMDNGIAERRWLLYTENANKLKFYGWNASNGSHATADAAFTINTWNFVCAWYDPADGKVHLSINNVETTASSALTGGPDGGAETFQLGKNGGVGQGYPMDGRLDEFGFWSRVLTAQEITDLYNSGTGLFY